VSYFIELKHLITSELFKRNRPVHFMTIHSRWAMALLLFGMVASIAPRSAKAAEGPWRWSNPRPHGNSIRAIAKGDDFFFYVWENC
jgi:hypothetical protein